MIDRRAIDRLYETVGSDPESLVEMIDSFLLEGPELVAQLVEAAALRDIVQMRRSAHSLKSNARDFGATDLGTLCAAIEEELRAGEDADCAARRAVIVGDEWSGVETALRALAAEFGRQE